MLFDSYSFTLRFFDSSISCNSFDPLRFFNFLIFLIVWDSLIFWDSSILRLFYILWFFITLTFLNSLRFFDFSELFDILRFFDFLDSSTILEILWFFWVYSDSFRYLGFEYFWGQRVKLFDIFLIIRDSLKFLYSLRFFDLFQLFSILWFFYILWFYNS